MAAAQVGFHRKPIRPAHLNASQGGGPVATPATNRPDRPGEPAGAIRWLALCDADGPFAANALRGVKDSAFVTAGSFVAEASLCAADGAAGASLFAYQNINIWERQFHIWLHPDGRLHVSHQQAGGVAHCAIALPLPTEPTLVRLTYGWNALRRTSTLTVELPAQNQMFQARADNPLPLPAPDLQAMCAGPQKAWLHPRLLWFGVSEGQGPTGNLPGMAGNTLITTPSGACRIDSLHPGDRVQTRDHGPLPVLWISHTDSPTCGSFTPIRLRAPFFGYRADLVVSQSQKIVLGGAEVEYLFGEDAVLIEAARLADGRIAVRDQRRGTMRLYSILLEQHAVIEAGGCGLESLYLADPALPGTLLHPPLHPRVPGGMAFHTRHALPVLRRFEAVTLLAMREQGRNPAAC